MSKFLGQVSRSLSCGALVGALLAALAALGGPFAASAPADTTVTQTFSTTGVSPFVVPVGVSAITVTAVGAPGGGGNFLVGGSGGEGARVTASVPVVGGSEMFVGIGGSGGVAPYPGSQGGSGGAGGGGAGGNSAGGCVAGAGGGGASFVGYTGSAAGALVVAGGGGGAGVGSAGGNADSNGATDNSGGGGSGDLGGLAAPRRIGSSRYRVGK